MALLKHPLRNVFPGHRGAVESGLLSGQTYAQKVLSYGPIAYWPLWEAAGPTAECLVNPAQNGTYTGVTLGQPGIGDGSTCPFFDGANDFVNIYSVAFNAAFNGQEGSLLIWHKVFNVGVWTDGLTRYIARCYSDDNNQLDAVKSLGNDRLDHVYKAGAQLDAHQTLGVTSVDWFCNVLTWSLVAGVGGETKAFLNGVQTDVTDTPIGTWVGALNPIATIIGAQHTGAPQWYGWLAHCAAFDSALTQPQITDLATV